MALWAVDKTMEEEQLRKKRVVVSFSNFLYLFPRVVSGGPTKEGSGPNRGVGCALWWV